MSFHGNNLSQTVMKQLILNCSKILIIYKMKIIFAKIIVYTILEHFIINSIHIEQSLYWKMNEIGITKIMDGLFIADDSITNDFQFLYGNKVSHIVVWIPDQAEDHYQNDFIKILKLDKNSNNGLMPQESQLNCMFDFIEESKDECLCCLICSSNASFRLHHEKVLLSTYHFRFIWDLKTSFNFIGLKFPEFNPRVQVVEQLQDYELSIIKNNSDNSSDAIKKFFQLKSIDFTYDYLMSYSTDNFDQKLLLNTIKNTFLQKIIYEEDKKHKKRRKRVQWFDRIRPSSSTATFSCKYMVYNRNLSLKSKSTVIQKQISAPYQVVLQKQRKPKIIKGSTNMARSQQLFIDDIEFQSLKDLTRTKLFESRLKGSLRKRTSLKLLKTNKVQKQNMEGSLQDKKKKSPFDIKKNGKKNNFLQDLKGITKGKLSSMGLSA